MAKPSRLINEQGIVYYGRRDPKESTQKTPVSPKQKDNFDLDLIGGSRISAIDISTLEAKLGEHSGILRKIYDMFSEENRKLKEELKLLRENTVFSPPAPRSYYDGEIKTFQDLKRYVIGLESYREAYFLNTNLSKVKLIALLDIIRDYSLTEDSLNDDPQNYIREALDSVNLKIDYYTDKAEAEEVSIFKWINANVDKFS